MNRERNGEPDRITKGSVAVYRLIEREHSYLAFGPQLFAGPRYNEWWEFEAIALIKLGNGIELGFDSWAGGPMGRWWLYYQDEMYHAMDLLSPAAPDIPIVWLKPPPSPPPGSFNRWAVGNLVDNVNRGLYAEWLVGQALGIIDDADHRTEWNSYDLRYRNLTIEVKASGISQTWNLEQMSTPRFDIRPRKMAWDPDTDQWQTFDPPRRLADIYVFCLHDTVPATNKDVQDPLCWVFWVVPTSVLDEELGGQKSVGVGTLNRLTRSVAWEAIPEVLSSFVGGDQN
ncbi:MAG: hypothetical protein OXJ55_06920 [Caldilineaceae bacterium]|nr:hypothetical protein [Caldilineaceae bacterium]MDE0499829.1 hypothetical protein [bacterium]MDE0501693.1 hypothetical protein [bacterium]